MATNNIKTSKKSCSKCDKTSGSFSCDGCQQSFCLKHVAEHRQELTSKIDVIELEHDIFHQYLLNEKEKHSEHILLNQINQWEKESIIKIQQVAEEARNELQKLLDGIIDHGNNALNDIFSELRRAREMDDFFETDLVRWTEQIKLLQVEIESLSNSIRLVNENSTKSIPFIEIIRSSTTKNSNTDRFNGFPWLNEVKTLINELTEKSSIMSKNEKKNAGQVRKKGCIRIVQVNNIDHYIDIEHDASTKNEQNMKGWTIVRNADKESKYIYKFPDNFILKCRSKVRILFEKENHPTKENDKEILIHENLQFWNAGSYVVTCLIDNNNDEKDSIAQKNNQ